MTRRVRLGAVGPEPVGALDQVSRLPANTGEKTGCKSFNDISVVEYPLMVTRERKQVVNHLTSFLW